MIILRNYGRNEGRILATTYPELAEQWNYEKNGALTPRDVTIGYSSKVWWTCPLGHEWETTVNNRVSSSTGCPYCAGRKVWPGFNDLASKRPDIAAEWNTEKNGDLTPRMVTTGTKRKVWWTCPLGHEYETYIRARTNGGGCPYCAGRKAWAGFNDLAMPAAAGSSSAARPRTATSAPPPRKPSRASRPKRLWTLTARSALTRGPHC